MIAGLLIFLEFPVCYRWNSYNVFEGGRKAILVLDSLVLKESENYVNMLNFKKEVREKKVRK